LILADTNVLLDVVTQDPLWSDWSRRQLDVAPATDEIAINDVVYAELSVGYQRMDELDYMIVTAGIAMAPMRRPARFLAGKAFQRYRQSVGGRTGVLPDFFISAHAVISAVALITPDARRYRTYFPEIMLITPN